MEFSELAERARVIRQQYVAYEQSRYGRTWTDEEIALGFVGDVGDLVKLVQGKNGVRQFDDLDARLEHELADCLWSLMVLAQAYHVDLEQAFIRTMDDLEKHLSGIEDAS
jgi:NTP pyrophosphatase (non-canonical NTP hydrolase)